MKLLESQIRPGMIGVPGSASSLPVDRTTTRGRGRTRTVPRPAAAMTAMCMGRSLVPLGDQDLAGLGVPAREPDRGPEVHLRADRDPRLAPVGPFHRHHGLGAVRQHRAGHDPDAGAGGSAYAPVSPAATSATTGSVTGLSCAAAATSSTRTA